VHDPDESWQCTDTLNVFDEDQGGRIYSTFVDHFTSFAVLLLPTARSNKGCSDEWGWMQITTMVLLACACSLCLVVSSLYVLIPGFRGVLIGQNSMALRKAQMAASILSEHAIVNSNSFLKLTVGGGNDADEESLSPLSGTCYRMKHSSYHL